MLFAEHFSLTILILHFFVHILTAGIIMYLYVSAGIIMYLQVSLCIDNLGVDLGNVNIWLQNRI
jgi:hypothetical protein